VEFKIDNWPGDPGYPEGDVTVTPAGDSSSGDIGEGLIVLWDSPVGVGASTVHIATIEIIPYNDTWIGSNYEMTVVQSNGGDLQFLDEAEAPIDVLGDHFICNCSSQCECTYSDFEYPEAPTEFYISIDVERDYPSHPNDRGNIAGYSQHTSDGYDPEEDQPEPPTAPEDYVTLYFHHPEWDSPFGDNFHTDIKAYSDMIGTPISWDFIVETDLTSTWFYMRLYFENWEEDNTFPITLVDLDSPKYYDITYNSQPIHFSSEDGVRSFRLILGPVYDSFQSSVHIEPGWALFSVPLYAFNWHPSWILEDDLVNQYFLFYHDAEGWYGTPGSLTFGQGYWLGVVTESNIDISGRLREFHSTNLEPGWHIAGTGQNTTYSIADIVVATDSQELAWSEAVTAGWVSPAVFGYNQLTGTYELIDTLNPWDAAWFGILGGYRTLKFNTFERDRSESAIEVAMPDWVLPISLRTTNGNLVATAELGTDSRASSNFDPEFDYPSPPPSPVGTLGSIEFAHPNWNCELGTCFTRDIQNLTPDTPLREWTLDVDISDEEALVGWDLSSAEITADIALTISDLTSPHPIPTDMRSTSYLPISGTGIHQFLVRAELTQDHTNEPPETSLFASYPNPFNPTTTLSFSLESSSIVSMFITDVRGRRIKTIHSGILESGLHDYIWDGTDLYGNSVSSGIYFGVLSTETLTLQHKMLLLK